MRTRSAAAVLFAAAVTLPALAGGPTALTPAERAAGWVLLLDGSDTSAWRGYKQEKFPAQGWSAKDGVLTQTPPGGGDIQTRSQYGDFEFVCSFKLDAKANSGIMWRVVEKHDTAWQTGPEYQLLEDHTYQGAQPGQMCGALYDLYVPAEGKKLNPAGEWNQARIRLGSGVIRQYVNGGKTVQARLFGEDGKPTKEWLDRIAASKFKVYEGFGLQPKGTIALQDHGGGVAFKDLKVRDLAAPMPGQVALFNGKDLSGWKAVVPDAEKAGIKPESVWEVKDGILVCKGNPVGYIRTEKDYTNYVLKLEWRFNPVTKQAGNSGVLLRMVGEDKVWPRSVEAQLQSGSAGDFWNIDEFKMKTDPARLNGRNTRKTHGNENPVGEWNEYEIIVDHGTVTLIVNGEVLNQATDVEELAGKICLQSEGAEIQFRNIRLAPIP